jgi:hypothetical protein
MTQHVDRLAAVNVDASTEQLQGVDRCPLQLRGEQSGHDARDHQRQDDLVVIGELKNDQDCRDRRVRAGADDSSHADQGVGSRAPGRTRPGGMHDRTNRAAEHGTDEQRRSEDPARPSRTDRQRDREDLDHDQDQQHIENHPTLQRLVDRLLADPEDLRNATPLGLVGEEVNDQTDDQAAAGGGQHLPPGRKLTYVVQRVAPCSPCYELTDADELPEADGTEPSQHADPDRNDHHVHLLCLTQPGMDASQQLA